MIAVVPWWLLTVAAVGEPCPVEAIVAGAALLAGAALPAGALEAFTGVGEAAVTATGAA
jgi:hypothetical protein